MTIKQLTKQFGYGAENYLPEQTTTAFNAIHDLLRVCGSYELAAVADILKKLSDDVDGRAKLEDELAEAGFSNDI